MRLDFVPVLLLFECWLEKEAMKCMRQVGGVGGSITLSWVQVLQTGLYRLPPFILYKGVNLYARWTRGGPAGAGYGVSVTGWMEGSNFYEWFRKMFLPPVAPLLRSGPASGRDVDGHHSHLSLELIQE